MACDPAAEVGDTKDALSHTIATAFPARSKRTSSAGRLSVLQKNQAAPAQTIGGHDRLDVIVVELGRGQLEIDFALPMPHGEEPVLRRCALDEALVGRDGIRGHAAARAARQHCAQEHG